MDIAAYVLLSNQQALRRQLDVAANNMANTSTVGFKREEPLFHDYVETTGTDAMAPGGTTAFVLDQGAIHDTRAGAFQPTGNPLDVMVDGRGWLSVELEGGGTGYTRAGQLQLNEAGELTTAAGARILDEANRPIAVPPEARPTLAIAPDGSVTGGGGTLGRIAVTRFADEAALSPRGDGVMEGAGGQIVPQAEVKLKSGGLEASNVQPIVETTHLVEVLRAYQTSQKLADSMDELRRKALDKLGRAN